MQVYRGMDIGTAKPPPAEQAQVPHYMIDLVEPEDEFSVAEFQAQARRIIKEHDEVLIVGGSGLHFRSIVDPLEFPPTDPDLRKQLEEISDPVASLVGADPGADEVIDMNNPRRVVRALEIFHLTGETPSVRARHPHRQKVRSYQPLHRFSAIGLDPGPHIGPRIDSRLERMRELGLWDEVAKLRLRLGRTASGAVGYRQLARAIDAEITADEGWSLARKATQMLARRQRTYFRRDPRIDWLPWDPDLETRTAAASQALGL
jgi:tRNA dimethylallyltransferase